ncbi:MAG: hypothetical protein KXJ49_11595 [Vulcanococcus sp.]|uniref:hypothetical protein n=1 Tax=Vulcanococcus sp. TaxID=2856995 RepID=UPI0025CE9980|nr:hypothetical protein [Vulcanococcus sp.]MBW0168138.1 hypothetical protein [Vulcanococcus sp.]
MTAGLAVAAGWAAGAGVEAGAAGMAVTGVVVLAAGLAAAGLPEAEVEVARDLGVAMAVMGGARERSR